MSPSLRSLAGNALTYGTGQVLNRIITFLLLPLFTAYLTPADYGISAVLGLIGFLIVPVFSLGLGASLGVSYFDGNNRDLKGTVIWTAFALLAASAGLLLALGLPLSELISRLAFGNPGQRHLVVLVLWSTAFSILAVPFIQYLQYEQKARTFVILSAVSTLVSIGLSVLLVVVLRKGVRGLIVSGLLGQAVSLALFMGAAASSLRPGFSRALGADLLRLGIPLVPSFAFLFVIQHANKYLLQWSHGLGQVGVYTIGFNLGMSLNLLVAGFTTAWYPYFLSFTTRREEAGEVFGRVTTWYVLGFGTASLLFYALAKPVTMLMTQPAFHESWRVVGPSATAQFLTGVFALLLPGLYFAREVKYVSLVQAAAAVAALGVNALLIPSLGIAGAGAGLALGTLALPVLQYGWNRRRGYLAVNYRWGRIARFGLLYVVLALGLLSSRDLSLRGEILLACAAAAGLGVLFALLLTREERRSLLDFLRRGGASGGPPSPLPEAAL